MAISDDDVFGMLDKMRTEGKDIDIDILQTELRSSELKSGGNRNRINALINTWCKKTGGERKGKTKKSAQSASKPLTPASPNAPPKSAPECNDAIINRLPGALRNPLIIFINAICTLVGLVRTQEREAATVLLEHARQEHAAALAEANQRIEELVAGCKRLDEENATLKAAVSAKQQSVLAEQLVEVMVKLLESGTLESIINASQPKERALKAAAEAPTKAASETNKVTTKAKVATKSTHAAGAKKSTRKAGGKKAA